MALNKIKNSTSACLEQLFSFFYKPLDIVFKFVFVFGVFWFAKLQFNSVRVWLILNLTNWKYSLRNRIEIWKFS